MMYDLAWIPDLQMRNREEDLPSNKKINVAPLDFSHAENIRRRRVCDDGGRQRQWQREGVNRIAASRESYSSREDWWSTATRTACIRGPIVRFVSNNKNTGQVRGGDSNAPPDLVFSRVMFFLGHKLPIMPPARKKFSNAADQPATFVLKCASVSVGRQSPQA